MSAFLIWSLSAAQLAAQTLDPGEKLPRPDLLTPPGESPTPPLDPSTGGDQPQKPLSEKLEEGEGVLKPPPGIDPEIKRPPPDPEAGTLRVIPPPGEPGGDQSVQPK